MCICVYMSVCICVYIHIYIYTNSHVHSMRAGRGRPLGSSLEADPRIAGSPGDPVI